MGWQQIMKLGHLHSSLIGIVRDSLKTASTAALPGVCLLIPVCLQSLDYAYLGEMRWYKGTPVVARQASYEEKRTTKFKSVDRRWISITFSGARWPYWKSNTTRKTSC